MTIEINAISAVAEYFERHCEQNTALWLIPGRRETPYSQGIQNDIRYEPVTVFHSKNVPEVSLFDLAKIIQKSCKAPVESLVMAFVLMARYEVESNQPITAHMMHRLFVASYQVALKLHSDFFYSNKYVASVMGIQTWEMNRLEEGLLEAMHWYASVSPRAYNAALTCPQRLFAHAMHCPLTSTEKDEVRFLIGAAAETTESDDEDCGIEFVSALFDRSASLSSDSDHITDDEEDSLFTVTPQAASRP